MTFFSLGNHHDFAIVAVGDDAPEPAENAPGLFHVAFRVGDSVEDLQEAKSHLEEHDVPIVMLADHTVTKSVYFLDPDANMLEVYIDTSDAWHADPQRVADFAPLSL
jgi:catechol 2,3-dioxygenase